MIISMLKWSISVNDPLLSMCACQFASSLITNKHLLVEHLLVSHSVSYCFWIQRWHSNFMLLVTWRCSHVIVQDVSRAWVPFTSTSFPQKTDACL